MKEFRIGRYVRGSPRKRATLQRVPREITRETEQVNAKRQGKIRTYEFPRYVRMVIAQRLVIAVLSRRKGRHVVLGSLRSQNENARYEKRRSTRRTTLRENECPERRKEKGKRKREKRRGGEEGTKRSTNRRRKGRFVRSSWIVTDNNAVPRISTRSSSALSIVVIVLSRPLHRRDEFQRLIKTFRSRCFLRFDNRREEHRDRSILKLRRDDKIRLMMEI